jgi:hypothetical protein
LVERKFAFKEDLSVCAYFDRAAWLRAQFDGAVLNDDASVWVYDLKTGKPRQEDKDQLSLFALASFMAYPGTTRVTCELWYSKTGNVVKASYTAEDAPALQADWFGKAGKMLSDREFLPLPNPLCGWCTWRKSNGGPCNHG